MTQPLQRFLGSGDTLAKLQDHADRLRRLQTLLEQFLPGPLSASCAVANQKGDVLILLARSGAAAARVKQNIPSLLEKFIAAGTGIASIQVKVTVTYAPEPPPPPQVRTLGGSGRESLEALKNSLPEDAPLRESLQRLLERSREP